MKTMIKGLLAIMVAAGLSACETVIEEPKYADLTFSHLGTIELNVAEINVVKAYQPSTNPPHVELEFPVSPLDTAARWATDRLKATGTSGVATVTITEASVKETALEKTDGITGAFTTDQSERYDAAMTMSIKAEDPTGRQATTTANVQRSTTVPEDVSLNERSKIWYQLTEKIMQDLDQQMVESINAHMKAFTF